MRIHRLHGWNLTPRRAIALQEKLRDRIVAAPLPAEPGTVAGADCAFSGGRIHAAVIVYSFPDLAEIERASASLPLAFPYVPGLLSFRECPVVLKAFSRLKTAPDVVFVDGHGMAHPRRMGLACHLGLWLDRPTLGCAKSVLVGEFGPLGRRKGSSSPLVHDGRTVGAAVRLADGVKPVFVSVGHRIALDDAIRLTLACSDGFRLPKPTREPDRWSKQLTGKR
jgi:deoxyribonuclease V